MKKRKSDGGTLFDMGSGMTSSNAEAIGGVEKTPEPAPVPTGGKMRLSDFVENPDNPQTITDQAFDRLLGKVERIPSGLTAKRIAYVTDHAAGKYVVLSGNKRLRALKRLHGDDFNAPDDWFQDITSMSEEQRNEFVVDANVNDGKFATDKLLAMYDRAELAEWVGESKLGELISIVESKPEPAVADKGDEPGAVALVELKIALSSADYKRATAYLRKRSDDISVAFMEVINGRT